MKLQFKHWNWAFAVEIAIGPCRRPYGLYMLYILQTQFFTTVLELITFKRRFYYENSKYNRKGQVYELFHFCKPTIASGGNILYLQLLIRLIKNTRISRGQWKTSGEHFKSGNYNKILLI